MTYTQAFIIGGMISLIITFVIINGPILAFYKVWLIKLEFLTLAGVDCKKEKRNYLAGCHRNMRKLEKEMRKNNEVKK